MKNEKDTSSAAPPKRTLKFTPKIPPRKLPKQEVAKIEVSETKDDVIDKQLLSKLNKAKASQSGFGRRIFKNEKKMAPEQVAFGSGDSSKARSFGILRSSVAGDEEGSFVPAPEIKKEYVEPWDYNNSYYPAVLPLRRPYSGDPEILNEQEFGEASTSSALDETRINAAADLGLMEEMDEPQLLFFHFPGNLPLWKRPAEAADSKDASGKKAVESKKGSRLEDLPGGFMGKLLVYKSGAVKMKLGDTLFDVSPGVNCMFAQDVAAINTREKHCCILGELTKRAVVTPDVDSLLASMDEMDM